MKKLLIMCILCIIYSMNIQAQSSESSLPYHFVNKQINGFMKLKKEQLKSSTYKKVYSLCEKYNYTVDNELSIGQGIEGDILFRFLSSNNEETAVITDSTGKMIEIISYLNEELKPYNTIVDNMNEKEYEIYNKSGEYSAAVKYITRNESWIEVFAKRKGEEKTPLLILFYNKSLKFLREEEKE